MRVLPVIFALFLAQPVFAGEKEFMAWGKSEAAKENPSDGSKHFNRKTELNFNELREEKNRAVKKPVAIKNDIESVRVLLTQKGMTLLLVAPKNIMKNATTIDDRYYETMKQCAQDRSWVVVSPENAWSEIDLNPYCAESYGEDEIKLALYWMRAAGKPYLEVVTNGQDCVPRKLYGWDKKAGKYILKAETCKE